MKNAFTLAEILITMGIIGVVSAMTVPALNQSWQRDAYTTQLRKVYSEVAQAAVRCKTDNNVQTLTEARISDTTIKDKFIDKYFVVIKPCGTSKTPCFAPTYKTVTGTSIASSDFHGCNTVDAIASGAALCTWWSHANEIRIIVDVNGSKDPNIIGRDVFAMRVHSNTGLVEDTTTGSFDSTKTNPIESGALKSIIDNGWKMTY